MLILLPLLILILILLLVRCEREDYGASAEIFKEQRGRESPEYIMPELAEGVTDWDRSLYTSDTEHGSMNESIAIPGYSNLVLSKDNPSVSLINPTDNSVYMVYSIFENGERLFETGAIGPDKALDLNLYELLASQEVSDMLPKDSDGASSKRHIVFKISTYDIDTFEPCNGASMEVCVTIL